MDLRLKCCEVKTELVVNATDSDPKYKVISLTDVDVQSLVCQIQANFGKDFFLDLYTPYDIYKYQLSKNQL